MYVVRNLDVLNYANGFTSWAYKNNEPVSTVMAPGYFNHAGDMLATGDTIFVIGSDGTTIVFVRSAERDVVTVTPLIALQALEKTP